MQKSKMFFLALAIVFSFTFSLPAMAEVETEDGSYYTLFDDDGNVLLKTGIVIQEGDKFVDQQNVTYEVYKVDESQKRAWAKKKEDQQNPLEQEEGEEPEQNEAEAHSEIEAVGQFAQIEEADQRRIGLYYTHSGESFIPTEGYAQTDQRRGGIYEVGAVLAETLEELEVEVLNDQTTHFPYSGSYRRSRRTASALLENDLDAIFDVHRDAAPWDGYYTEIDGEPVTQVLIVVGTQNPTYRANEGFAWWLKAVADEQNPGLMKGIFYARGDYNQDLHPRSLLLEIGGHQNSREHAEEGARLFAPAIVETLYGDPEKAEEEKAKIEKEAKTKPQDEEDDELDPKVMSTIDRGGPGGIGGIWQAILSLFLLAFVGGAIYLFISVGDTREIKRKLRKFFKKEFANQIKRHDDDEEKDK
ncbi:stage II sporulation protein P [Proteinivorax hydrogeniformans]|uniref:Stage II sporulation protein P n=1 Tax=Proteinivorax hydrogeniformans TaxID=1826727 RepID=A0AAU8HV65_9FIRM